LRTSVPALQISANALYSLRARTHPEPLPFFAGAALAALVLRLLFVCFFPAVVDDSRLYANIAQNWLQRSVYGVTDSGQVVPTLSRLPGYPAFLRQSSRYSESTIFVPSC